MGLYVTGGPGGGCFGEGDDGLDIFGQVGQDSEQVQGRWAIGVTAERPAIVKDAKGIHRVHYTEARAIQRFSDSASQRVSKSAATQFKTTHTFVDVTIPDNRPDYGRGISISTLG